MMTDRYISQLLSKAYLTSTEQTKKKKKEVKFEMVVLFENKQKFAWVLFISVLPVPVNQIISNLCCIEQSLL